MAGQGHIKLIGLLDRLLAESKYEGRKGKFMAHIVSTPRKHYKIKCNLSQVYRCSCGYIIQQCGKVTRECGYKFSRVSIAKNNFMETIVF